MNPLLHSIDGLLKGKRRLQHVLMLRHLEGNDREIIYSTLKRGYGGGHRIDAMLLVNKHKSDETIMLELKQIDQDIDLRLEKIYTPI